MLIMYKNWFFCFRFGIQNTTCSELIFFREFNEQSLVILWVNWFKNESFWKRFTCTVLKSLPTYSLKRLSLLTSFICSVATTNIAEYKKTLIFVKNVSANLEVAKKATEYGMQWMVNYLPTLRSQREGYTRLLIFQELFHPTRCYLSLPIYWFSRKFPASLFFQLNKQKKFHPTRCY